MRVGTKGASATGAQGPGFDEGAYSRITPHEILKNGRVIPYATRGLRLKVCRIAGGKGRGERGRHGLTSGRPKGQATVAPIIIAPLFCKDSLFAISIES